MTDQFDLKIAEARRAVMAASSADMPEIFRQQAIRLLTPPQDFMRRQRIITALQAIGDSAYPSLNDNFINQVFREIPHTANNGHKKCEAPGKAEDAASDQAPKPKVPLEDEAEDEDEIKVEELDGEAVDAEDALESLASEQPGLLGEIIDWICASARYPNPILAVGAAITVLGTLMGRRIRGPTKSATHLYVIGLAPTGAGKQHILDCARLLMREARASHLLGPSEFTSMSAVLHFLVRQPLSLCLQDEFGAFLKRINHNKATGWEVGVTKTFRSIWGTSFKAMETPEWAGLEFKTIESPALSILGMSVPEEFYQSLSNRDIVNGLLNRFLILANSLDVEEREPEADADIVPQPLIDRLRELYGWDRQLMAPGTFTGKPMPEDIGWANDDAHECYRIFGERMKDQGRKYSALGLGELFTRSAELAVRLATIRAVGCRGKDTMVEVSDIEWGRRVAQASAMLMVAGAERHMAENRHVADRKRILDLFRKQPVMTRNQLLRKAYWLRARDLDEHMTSLVDGGIVGEKREPTANVCKPIITYKLKFRP